MARREELDKLTDGILATIPILNWSAKEILKHEDIKQKVLIEMIESYIEIVERLTTVLEHNKEYIKELENK